MKQKEACAQVAIVTATLTIYVAIIFTSLERAISVGICCADDEAMATIAKNLAFGYGYTSSVSFTGVPGLFAFDWGISTGPTLILPAAGLIAIFGNEPWVPGLTTVLAMTILLVSVACVHAYHTSISGAAGYMFLFALILFALTQNWFLTWAALFGEIPAGLLIVLGATLWLYEPKNRAVIVLSGLCFGLALLTKYVSIFGMVPMVAWLASGVLHRTATRVSLELLGLMALGFSIPILSFEIWKLAALGAVDYAEVWRQNLDFVFAYGISDSLLPDLITRVEGKLALFNESFQHPILTAALLLGVGIIVVHSSTARGLFAYFAAALLIHWTWWLFASPTGWARYMLIGLVYQAAALASVAYALRPNKALAAAAVVVLIAVHYPDPLASTRVIQRAAVNRFHETDELKRLRMAAKVLSMLPRQHKFVTANWTTAVGLEYMMPTVGNFIRYDHATLEMAKTYPLYVVLVSRWGDTKMPGFPNWQRQCQQIVFNEHPIWIARC